MKIKPLCILVDDETSALEALKDKIESLDLLEIERAFNDPDKFLVAVDSLSSQIVFLDMDMPMLFPLKNWTSYAAFLKL